MPVLNIRPLIWMHFNPQGKIHLVDPWQRMEWWAEEAKREFTGLMCGKSLSTAKLSALTVTDPKAPRRQMCEKCLIKAREHAPLRRALEAR